MPRIPFGPWTPDEPPLDGTGLVTATNVSPQSSATGYYRSWPALTPISNALSGAPLGGVAGKSNDGKAMSFAGDMTKLYRLQASTWGDVSRVGGYSTATPEVWRFVPYGYDIIATNYSDAIQKFTIGTSTKFADMSATAPRARHLAVVRDFLVTGNTSDTDGQRALRVRWSPLGNPSGDWTPNATLQTDFQDLTTGDEIMGLVGGEYGAIICRSAIYRMTFVGPPLAFQFDEVVRNHGCAASGSLATDGTMSVFYAEDGFYIFNGVALTPIGVGKINRWFEDNVAPSSFPTMSAQIDATRQLYVLLFTSKDSPNGQPDTLLQYNWVSDRWTIIRQPALVLVRLLSTVFTLEDLDTVSMNLDVLPASLDSRLWSGGVPYLGAFTQDLKFSAFAGPALVAEIETGEAALGGGVKARVQTVRPLCDGEASVVVKHRDDQWGPQQETTAETPTRAGDCKFNVDARFHSMKLTIGGPWTVAQGVDFTFVPTSET
ncbi:hypothetical protein E9232_004893 [Inquilinus ginsengisoli]|uniref:Uncharacterized protein n=1 Tax=Inquilinus ginsengisoli TaxID=363840 RepID=A0ABU1JUR6_9PROT|nr:hypothetical protein [Inquilinus ginsengisoli]MDR6292353.1 hypothetical protein [Inquilinus ginsengisoli]